MSGQSRKLSDEEVAALGLPSAKDAAEQAAPTSRKLSDDEVAQLGLPPTGGIPAKPAAPSFFEHPLDRIHYDLSQPDPAGEKLQPAMWGALAAGAHAPALAMEGPIAGAGAAVHEFLSGDAARRGQSIGDAYRAGRDKVEKAQAQNLKDFPHAPLVGALLTNPGNAPSAFGRLMMAAGQGGAYGLGESKADLTKGQVGPALRDTAIGTGIGLGGGLVGEGLQAVGRGIGNKLGNVLQKNDDAVRTAAEKAFNSARGAYGGEVSSAARTLEVLEKAASDPNLPEEISRQAAEFLDGPEAKALRQQVIRSSLGRGPDQLGRIQAARDAMASAGQALQPDALASAAQVRLDSPSAFVRRLRDLVPKIAGPVIGGALAGPLGAGAGALAASASGRPGTTMANLLKDPYIASRLFGAGTTAAVGAGGAIARGAPAAVMTPVSALDRYLGYANPDDEEQQR